MDVTELTHMPLNNLKEERVRIASALHALDQAIKILERSQGKSNDWKNNSMNCLKNKGCPMRTVEILNCMFYDEPEVLDDEIKKRNYTSALSIALNNLCDKGILDRLPIAGYKGFYYGLKDWFNKPHVLKMKYQEKLSNHLWVKEAKIAIH